MIETGRFAERVRELRKREGLTQHALAKKVDVTQQAVGLWETGKAVPGGDAIIKLSRVFDVPSDDLLGLDGDRYAKLEKRIARLERIIAGNFQLPRKIHTAEALTI